MRPELLQKGPLYEEVYYGLFHLWQNALHRSTNLKFLQFSDVARELTDFTKFSLQPNKHTVARDHYVKVSFYWTWYRSWDNLDKNRFLSQHFENKLNVLKMLDYTLSDGQRYFFNITANLYLDLMANKGITTEHIKQAYLLGWSIELVSLVYFNSNLPWHDANYMKICLFKAFVRLSDHRWH